MVKNLFSFIAIGLLIIGLSVAVVGSKVPIPVCNAPKVGLNNLPITLDETQTYNMNDIFSGYNIKLSIQSKP
jgi:hypothetical protein